MISSSLKSPKIFDTKAIKINHEHLDSVIHKYTFLHVKMQSDVDNNKIIYQNISSSNVVIINQYEEKDPDIIYFIIGFRNTIIIIEESQFLILQPLFSTKKCLKICFAICRARISAGLQKAPWNALYSTFSPTTAVSLGLNSLRISSDITAHISARFFISTLAKTSTTTLTA